MRTTITADSTPRPKVPNTVGDPEIDARIRQLVADMGGEKPSELIVEMVTTAMKMAREIIPSFACIRNAGWSQS